MKLVFFVIISIHIVFFFKKSVFDIYDQGIRD